MRVPLRLMSIAGQTRFMAKQGIVFDTEELARFGDWLDHDERYARTGNNSPYEFYWSQMLYKMKRGKRLYVFKSHKEQADEEITLDYVMDNCVIHGSVNKVVDQILALREEIGDFGELVYAGMDWVEPALNKRSMQLMAEEVMPRVNAAIGKSAVAA